MATQTRSVAEVRRFNDSCIYRASFTGDEMDQAIYYDEKNADAYEEVWTQLRQEGYYVGQVIDGSRFEVGWSGHDGAPSKSKYIFIDNKM